MYCCNVLGISDTQDEYVRDITQAYTQSLSYLDHSVFLESLSEMEILRDSVLQAIKPLYGIPEAALHWFITYQDHHANLLGMRSCTAENCSLFRYNKLDGKKFPDITILQVDDSFGCGYRQFLQEDKGHS